jgi:subtilisin family serine protease
MATVSAYATADRAFGACSYGTRQSSSYEILGNISDFSSRGPRIDGLRLVDLCAPGDNDVVWAQSSRSNHSQGGYTFGGGTSASAPHVAGAIALLRQAAPWASVREIEDALFGGAASDEFVGDVPNHTWGYGKLRISGALALLPPQLVPEANSVDLAPWEGGLTPEPPPPVVSEGRIVGVEGGGCHCAAVVTNEHRGALAAMLDVLRILSR